LETEPEYSTILSKAVPGMGEEGNLGGLLTEHMLAAGSEPTLMWPTWEVWILRWMKAKLHPELRYPSLDGAWSLC